MSTCIAWSLHLQFTKLLFNLACGRDGMKNVASKEPILSAGGADERRRAPLEVVGQVDDIDTVEHAVAVGIGGVV